MKFGPTLVIFALAGCGTTSGVREFQSYARAFDAVEEASDVVLARIVASERSARIEIIDSEGDHGISETLNRDQITTFAPSADPPFVGSMRFAITTVAQFNDVMLAYAEGRAIGILTGEIESMRAAGIGFEAPIRTDDRPLSTPIAALNSGLQLLAGVGSREAFRVQLKDAAQQLDTVLDVMLKNSNKAYSMLTLNDFADLEEAAILEPSAVPAIREKIAKKREMLAEWLHLIQISREALASAVAAIDAPQSSSARLVEAAIIAGDLRARAEFIKRLAAEN